VTDTAHGTRLVRRVVQEHRRTVFLLTAAFVLNLLIYGVVVRPLERSVANVEQSTVAAEQALTAAQAEHAKADGTRTGKDRASKELATFYTSVLAQDLAGARRLTYGRLSRLAEQSRLMYRSGKYAPVEDRGSELTKLRATVELTGSYANMRTFIHAIETAPEFVVINNMELAEGATGDDSLRLSLELSTYFRNDRR
jgi:predicted component of type VI protein secretion system